MDQHCVSAMKFTEVELDRGGPFYGVSKHVYFYLIPESRREHFWWTDLWKAIQAVQGEVIFYKGKPTEQ